MSAKLDRNTIDSFKKMPVLQVLRQPSIVWQCVEVMAKTERHFKTKTVACGGDPTGLEYPEPGWMKPEHLEPLLAMDVPVLNLFTICALKYKYGDNG